MRTTRSADGTMIAFDQVGSGPAVILVGAAFNSRSSIAPLAEALGAHFTVFNYDRRGRGDSGDTAPYAVVREIEDLDALIAAAGGSAFVFGYSSGAVLALKAAASGLRIAKLALYEPPFLVDESRPRPPVDLAKRLTELVAAGRRGDAVELYQAKAIGLPEDIVLQLRHAPFRPALEAIAHTLVYDATITGDLSLPTQLMSSMKIPTLVLAGDQTSPFLRAAARAAADALPNGEYRALAGRRTTSTPLSHPSCCRSSSQVLPRSGDLECGRRAPLCGMISRNAVIDSLGFVHDSCLELPGTEM